MSSWTEEEKAKALALYEEGEPTSENSMAIVESIADELGKTVNGVRMFLTKQGVYVKKAADAPKASTKSASSGGGGTKVSKQAAQDALVAAIEAKGGNVDADIISKLTGKAAVYFAELLK